MPLKSLYPQRPFFWFVWLAAVLIMFPIYYFDESYYPQINQEYEQTQWLTCQANPTTCFASGYSDNMQWQIDVKIPRYVADFVESPVEIRLTNITTETQPVVVVNVNINSTLSESGAQPNFSVSDESKNTIIFESIPPRGQVIALFGLEIAGGQESEEFVMQVEVNGIAVRQGFDFRVERPIFDRLQVFKLWSVQYLLSPPGANIVIPVSLLLIVSIGEWAYVFGRYLFKKGFPIKLRQTPRNLSVRGLLEQCKQTVQKFWLLIAYLLGITLLLSYWNILSILRQIWSIMPANVGNLFVGTTLFSIVSGLVIGWLWGYWHNDQGKEKQVAKTVTIATGGKVEIRRLYWIYKGRGNGT